MVKVNNNTLQTKTNQLLASRNKNKMIKIELNRSYQQKPQSSID